MKNMFAKTLAIAVIGCSVAMVSASQNPKNDSGDAPKKTNNEGNALYTIFKTKFGNGCQKGNQSKNQKNQSKRRCNNNNTGRRK